MKEVYANVWDFHKGNNYVGVTTNGIVQNGQLIMGGGIALEAKNKFRLLPYTLGTLVTLHGNHVYFMGTEKVFSFPTKQEVWLDSKLDLIEQSCQELKAQMVKLPDAEGFYLVRPGCGLGGLDWETQVKPLIIKYFENEDRLIIVERPHASN